jgi:O-antigen/teichoic acid export membrane protein
LSRSELEPPIEPDSEEPAELTDTVVRGAGLAGAGFLVAQVLTLGFYVALARLATPTDFGDLAAGTILVNVGLLFSESGLLAALIHRKDRIDEAASTAVIATIVAGLVFGLLALALSPLVGLIFDSTRVGQIAAASAGLIILRPMRIVPEAILQRRFSFLRRLIIEPVGVLAFGVSAVIMTANGLGVWGLVLAYYVSEVVDVTLSWALVRWRPRLKLVSFSMWRELARYGRWGLASNVLQNVEQQLPVLLLGRFAGANPLGQFRYAARMESTAQSVVVQAGSYVLFPALARITEDRERFRDACMRALRSMSIVGFPLGLILVPLGVPAAVLAFGDVWRDAGYAAMALAAVPAAGTLISFASEMLKADGRPDLLTRIRTVTLIAAAAAMIALVPFDLVGVCLGFSIGTSIGAVYAMAQAGRQLEVPAGQLAREILPGALPALVMAAVLTPLEFLVIDASSYGTAVGLLLLIGEGALGLAVFLASLRLISPSSFTELISLLGRLLRRGRSASGEEAGDAASSQAEEASTEASDR